METNLLERCSIYLGCMFLSDLRFISKSERKILAAKLEEIDSDKVPLCEWNDALSYLTKCSAESTAENAKEKLVRELTKQPNLKSMLKVCITK